MQKQIKLIPANKNNRYQIKDNEGDFYHLLFVEEVPTADNRVLTGEKIVIFSKRDFKQYLNNKNHFNWKHEEIIHDPTLTVAKEEMPVQPTTAEPAATPPPVKKVNAGLAAYREKQKELKQSKLQNQ